MKTQARFRMKLTDKVAVTEGEAMMGLRYNLMKDNMIDGKICLLLTPTFLGHFVKIW